MQWVQGSPGSRARTNPLFDDPFFHHFFNIPEQGPVVPCQNVGSGVIVDAKEGYVLTNHHVIDNADARLFVVIP